MVLAALRRHLWICVFGAVSVAQAQVPAPRPATAFETPYVQPKTYYAPGSPAPAANGAVPRLIRFGGMLKDPGGQPKTGIAGVTFAIYADQDRGAPLWMETQNVQLDQAGRYTVLLGANSNEGVPLDLFTTGQARWLGVEAQDIEEVRRVLLVSVPYSLKAADAETLGGMPASAFTLANPQPAASANQSGTASKSNGAQVKAPTGSVPQSAATATVDNDFLAKFNSTSQLVPSAIFESNGNVGIGTTNPLAPLQVNGNTLLVQSGTTAQVQATGAAASGRFGQDAGGIFLASDTNGSPLRFLANNGSLNEWMRIGSGGSVNIGSAQPSQHGEAVFAPDNLDTVHSLIGQAGSQYHFRLSRATPDDRGARDFLITPYNYGTAIEYPGVVEFWNQEFSVHMHPSIPGRGAYFWVGDEIDSGGLFVTAMDNGGGSNSYVTLAADRFAHASHGSLNFVVRNTTDAFKFDVGPYGSEVMKGQISGTASASTLDLFSGSVQATVRAQSGSSAAVELGSTSDNALSLFTNNGAAQVTLFPSGNFSIGNNSDTAALAVGTAAQFQVSSAGALTIGGGTPITQHLSVSASLAFPQFAPLSCDTLSFTVAGAVDGNSVALGIPNALASTGGMTWFGWVSAPDMVSVRGCNATNQTVSAPPAANVRVDVWQH